MSGISFFNKLKRWWFDTTNLFTFKIEIWLLNIHVVMAALIFDFEIRTDIPLFFIDHNRVKNIFSRILRFNKYKGGNIELYFYYNFITGVSITKLIHCDHTHFELEISILGLTFYFYKYDYRHWDDDNDRYEG